MNSRPQRYECCALTTWATPTFFICKLYQTFLLSKIISPTKIALPEPLNFFSSQNYFFYTTPPELSSYFIIIAKAKLWFVAELGIEPSSGGYEPPEIPFLYSAIFLKKPLIQKVVEIITKKNFFSSKHLICPLSSR